MDVFVSWSGGKDCCLAAYRAIREGLNIKYLATVVINNDGSVWPELGNNSRRVWPHLVSPRITKLQAEAMGIPIIEPITTVEKYDDTYRSMLKALKAEGLDGGVFGDVSVGNSLANKHESWIDSVCNPTGMKVILPLWDENRASLLWDFIESGFTAIVIVADDSRLGKGWLGRKLNREMFIELKNMAAASPTGEVGYYHTLVIDGPIFKKKLEIVKTDKIQVEGHWYLDIKECRLINKTLGSIYEKGEAVAVTQSD
jgi:uncharacterized protein (TIGR00290 family)